MFYPGSWRKLRQHCEQVTRTKPSLTVGSRLISVRTVTFDLLPPAYEMITHAHSAYELIVLLNGQALYVTQGEEQLLGRGCFFLTSPQTKHGWRVLDAPCASMTASFFVEPSIVVPVMERWLVYAELADEAERFRDELLAVSPGELFAAAGLLMSIIGHALSFISPEPQILGQATRKHDLRDELEHLLARDLSRQWTLDAVASHVGMSTRQLTRAFCKVSNYTVTNHILYYRLNIARSLLRESDETITEICAQVGIPNRSYFHRRFYKFFGITPNEYRNIARQ